MRQPRWLERIAPGWVLVGAGLLAALAFPATGAGGAGMLIVIGALGVAVVDHAGKLPLAVRRPPRTLTGAIAVGVVVVAGAAVFGRLLDGSPGWTMGDWGVQHAVLKDVIAQVAGNDVTIIDSAETTAGAVETILREKSLLATGTGSSRFLCTDAPGRFAHLGQIFLGELIDPGSVTLVDL